MGNNNFDFEPVDSLIQQDIENGFPGCVLYVSGRDQVLKSSAYGFKNRYDSSGNLLAAPEPMKLDTLFDVASNSKIYSTVFSLMYLASNSSLDIDQKVTHYIPGYIHKDITVRSLLNHSSGYGPEVWFFTENNQYGKEFYSTDRDKTIDLLVTKVPLSYKTDTKAVYSDTGFLLLGLIIEQITGMSQDEFFEKELCRLLVLKNSKYNPISKNALLCEVAATSFGNGCNGTMDYPNIRKEVIRGEVQDEKAYYSMAGVAGHAGLFSIAEDILKIAQLILNMGQVDGREIISKNVIEDFTRPSEVDSSFGCGWRIFGDEKQRSVAGESCSKTTIGHTGFTGTFTSIDFENEVVVVLLSNKIHTVCAHRQSYAGNGFDTGKYYPVVDKIYKCLGKGN